MTNKELQEALAFLQEGDKIAFEKIYTELKTPMLTIILRMTQDRALAEDILQEVFVKLYRSPPNPSISNPRAYLFQMARNLAIDGMRKQPRDVALEDYADFPQSPIEHRAAAMDIEAALDTLPLVERQIVTLHINGDLTFRVIADMMELPLGTVLWKYQRAMKRLRLILDGGTI